MIPFNRPHLTGRELSYVQEAAELGQLAGDGRFTRRCQEWLERRLGSAKALLTHSGTGALEMAALLLDLQPGDEVIMPSFTFVSTANAVVLRRATPVFVDVRPDTLNLDERLVEAAVTSRTRAIVAVHYAGIACDMDAIADIARRHDLAVVEDAAQGLLSSYRGRPLGALGHLAAISFHETKNVIAGEGGALLVNDLQYAERAEAVWQKGTDRTKFARGLVDKYRWVDVGSSFLPGELTAAFLWAQLEQAEAITAARLELWRRYERLAAPLEALGVRGPVVPPDRVHNAHLYYVILPRGVPRAEVLDELNRRGVNAVFHYVPLHQSPGGRRFGRTAGPMQVTEDCSERLIRLPLWVGMGTAAVETVVGRLTGAVSRLAPGRPRPPASM
jgi:dTDP-4-amino-4,6-dideoxygalactose transaminase